MPIDYEIPIDYKSRELVTSTFSKKDKQDYEQVTKILLPKTGSTCSCSKFEILFVYAIT